MDKQKLTAKVIIIDDLVQIRRTTKPDMYKRVIGLETEDNQVLYPELRNTALKMLDREGVEVGSIVEVTYKFHGSEKDGKRYNNILIQNIKVVK